MTIQQAGGQWDAFAAEYEAFIARREEAGVAGDPILARLLELLGDLDGKRVLDAGCGEGFLARILAGYGARVTGADLSPRLIEAARRKDPDGQIEYRVADLSQPIADLRGELELVASYLALNDVADLAGFAETVANLVTPGGRIVMALNNPYSSVIREHITDYFASGTLAAYGGLGTAGVRVRYYHRPLEEYLDAFLTAGLRLVKLADVTDPGGHPWLLPSTCRFPRFMVLAFEKP